MLKPFEAADRRRLEERRGRPACCASPRFDRGDRRGTVRGALERARGGRARRLLIDLRGVAFGDAERPTRWRSCSPAATSARSEARDQKLESFRGADGAGLARRGGGAGRSRHPGRRRGASPPSCARGRRRAGGRAHLRLRRPARVSALVARRPAAPHRRLLHRPRRASRSTRASSPTCWSTSAPAASARRTSRSRTSSCSAAFGACSARTPRRRRRPPEARPADASGLAPSVAASRSRRPAPRAGVRRCRLRSCFLLGVLVGAGGLYLGFRDSGAPAEPGGLPRTDHAARPCPAAPAETEAPLERASRTHARRPTAPPVPAPAVEPAAGAAWPW